MKITLLVIGKTDADYLIKAIEEYTKRLSHYTNFILDTLPDIKNTKNITTDQQKEKEGELLLKYFSKSDFVVLLDEGGKEMTSVQFAEYIDKKMNQSIKHLLFVIGGPYGFSKEIYERMNEKISLSRMTFSHQMVRLIFTEQLYRAMTILNNEPYHHN